MPLKYQLNDPLSLFGMCVFRSTGLVGLYVFYVVVVILGRVLYQGWKKKRRERNGKLGIGDIPSKGSLY